MRNMAFQKVGDYFVLVHNAMSPADEEWDEWLEFYSFGSLLVVTDGGAPTASQRKRMKDRVEFLRTNVPPGTKDPRTAIMTASSFVRGVITALRWFYYHDAYAAFPPEHLSQAMTYLEAPPRYHQAIKTAVQNLRMQLKKAKSASGTSGTRPGPGPGET